MPLSHRTRLFSLSLVVGDQVLQLVGVDDNVKPAIWSSLNSALSTQAKQTSFPVFVLLAFPAPSTTPCYSFKRMRVLASLAKLEMLL